jgi:hypothetical protein
MDVALGDEAASLMRLIGGITMSAPSGFRFTLGQLMGVVAVSAVFLAVTTLSISGHHTSLFVISFSISLAGIAVFLQNVRLSRWIWVALAGYAGPLLLTMILNLASAMWPSSLHGDLIVTLHLAPRTLFSFLFVAGMAMAFRDVRRRLASREG